MICARHIVPEDCETPPDTYVKCYIKDGDRLRHKKKTRVVRHSAEPYYKQTLKYQVSECNQTKMTNLHLASGREVSRKLDSAKRVRATCPYQELLTYANFIGRERGYYFWLVKFTLIHTYTSAHSYEFADNQLHLQKNLQLMTYKCQPCGRV